MKLSPKALGLTFAILCGLSIFIATLLATYTGYTADQLQFLLVGIYPYYEISVTGSFLGLVYGFIDGLIGGLVVAWLYNLFVPEKK